MTGVFKYFYGCPQEVFKFICLATRVELEATGTSSREVGSGSKYKKLFIAAENGTGCLSFLKIFLQGLVVPG